MAIVTGTAADCDLAAYQSLGLELIFTLNDAATSGATIYLPKPVVVPVVNGSWLASIPDTETMDQKRFYRFRARWLEDRGASFPDWELHVPVGGGSFADLVTGYSTNPYTIFEQPTEPDPWPVGTVWLNTTTWDLTRKDS